MKNLKIDVGSRCATLERTGSGSVHDWRGGEATVVGGSVQDGIVGKRTVTVDGGNGHDGNGHDGGVHDDESFAKNCETGVGADEGVLAVGELALLKGKSCARLGDLSDGELETRLYSLGALGRKVELAIVRHLMEVEARKLHLARGVNSLFRYCQERLGFSEYEAFSRTNAARMARIFPAIVGMLERRELGLTTLYLVRDYVTVENHAEIFSEVTRKTKQEVLLLMARRCPRPDVPARFRKLPAGVAKSEGFEALSASSYLLQMTVSEGLKGKIELARDLMSHANARGDLAAIVERGVDLLLAKLEQQRFGKKKTARSGETGNGSGAGIVDSAKPKVEPNGSSSPRQVARARLPTALRRRVVDRDGVGCSFVGSEGQRCGARALLEFDHVRPWAQGGDDSFENLRLVCAAHNRWLAEQEYGAEHVRAAIARNRSKRRRAA